MSFKIGITGHQDLIDAATREWVELMIAHVLDENDVSVAYSCLAAGSDQVFARVVIQKGIVLAAIIPCQNYESTFDEQDLGVYRQLLKSATSVSTLNFSAPSERAFFEAGKKVVESSDIIIGVWNGEKARGLGGTADVIAYAGDLKTPVIHLNTITKIRRRIG